MLFNIRLFAGLAEIIGHSSLSYEIDESAITAGRLKELLSASYPAAASLIAVSLVAINREYAADDSMVPETAEIALIPPVSGGEASYICESSDDGLFSLTDQPLIAEDILNKVLDSNHGASLLFVGTTREMTGDQQTTALFYEAYIPMALAKLQEIGQEVRARWNGKCAITHRTGLVGLKEASVIIAVSSPHRDSCYEASRYAIEKLKEMVPIWKQDINENGQSWKGPDGNTTSASG